MEKEYTIQELAIVLKISSEEVHDYLLRDKIPFIKTGRRYLISQGDLARKKRSTKRKVLPLE